jgi:DNA-binding transcriptional regulator YiaG
MSPFPVGEHPGFVDLGEMATVAKARELCMSGALLALRLAAGRPVRVLASELGVAPSTVSRWEHGQRLPAGRHAVALLQAAGEMAGR